MGDTPATVTVVKVFGRFIAGRPLDGVPRTNSTFLQPGTKSLIRHRDHPSRWAALPGWKRSAWRLGTCGTAAAQVAGWLCVPTLTTVADAGAGTALTAYGTYRARRAWRVRRHRRDYVSPLHTVLAPALGLSARHTRPAEYLTVPVDYATNEDAEIVVKLPPQLHAAGPVRQVVEDIITSKLALSDVDTAWRVAGREPVLIVRQAPRPPAKAPWASGLAAVEAAPDSSPVIGFGHRGKVVGVDLDAESPHVLVSAGSGGGKSVLVRVILAQGLHRGGRAVICDVKRVSHRWARGLPGVEYHRTPEEIHNALIALALEGDRRFEIIEEDGDAAEVGPRYFLVMEEMNATITRLQRYWESIRTKEDPKRSPAVDAFGDILFMGRQGKIHVIAVGQMMTARTLGGPEIRENFATRILARYSRNAWKMLTPEIWPPPKASRHAGRVQVVLAGTAHETQVLFPSESEAREWAAGGVPSVPVAVPDAPAQPATAAGPPPSWGEPVTAVTEPSRAPDPAEAASQRHSDTVPAAAADAAPAAAGTGRFTVIPGGRVDVPQNAPERELFTLADATRNGIVECTYDALRQAKTRDPEFPPPDGRKGRYDGWTAESLQRWERNRPSAEQSG